MPLPNPGLDAVPFTPLTAQFLDEMNQNIESLAAGTGFDDEAIPTIALADEAVDTDKLADGSVTTPKLADSAVTGTKVADKGIQLSKINGGTTAGHLLSDESGNVSVAPNQVRILRFNTPSTGQVAAVGTADITYDGDEGVGDRIVRVNNTLRVLDEGFYMITANIRIIDVVQGMLHQVMVSTDGGSTWNDATMWAPHTHVTPANTLRSLPPISVVIYLPADAYLKHRQDHQTGNSRIGGLNGVGRFHTSLAVTKIS